MAGACNNKKRNDIIMNNKQIALAKKLHALAESGIGGEKQNAKQMLDALMVKYNLTMEDIEGEKISREEFRYKNGERKLLVQVIASVMGAKVQIFKERNRNLFYVECTKAEYANILASFEHYRNAYKRDLKIHFSAFIQKNEIFPTDGESVNTSELSEEERKMLYEVGIMMCGMRRQPLPRKRIEGGAL